jgi:hypothetical protein
MYIHHAMHTHIHANMCMSDYDVAAEGAFKGFVHVKFKLSEVGKHTHTHITRISACTHMFIDACAAQVPGLKSSMVACMLSVCMRTAL